MSLDFWSRVILSFLVGGLWVTAFSIVAERRGTKLGGLLGTLPSTLVVALLFIGFNDGPAYAASVVPVIPAVMGVNAMFLFLYIKFLRYGTVVAPLAALGCWALMSLPLVIFDIDEIWLTIPIFAGLTMLSYYLLEHLHHIPEQRKGRLKYTRLQLASRGVLAGAVIAFAVVMAHFGGPLLGGLFSVFPALFLSTMLLFSRQHGPDFAAAMGKTMAVGGVNVVTYGVACHFLYPVWGLAVGTVAAYLISLIGAVVSFQWIKRMK